MRSPNLAIVLKPNGAVEFDRYQIRATASDGTPYTRWVSGGMPKLGQYQYLLDAVFFLYPDAAAAKDGMQAGGTGFLVSIPSTTYPDHYHHIYAVSNWHVAVDGCPVIRVNNHTGPPAVFSFEPHEWYFMPQFHDIAVIPLDDLKPGVHKVEAIDANSFFLGPDEITEFEINAGEDTFMLGRFIDYDGVEANSPSMRFGNISMMAADQMQPNGYRANSIVVDMHSRTGYSGSPVFVYRTAGSVFMKPETFLVKGHMLKLLGILWGQFPEEWDILEASTMSKDRKHGAQTLPILTGKSIKGMSGMSLVAPASAIRQVLDLPELSARRAKIDAELHCDFANAPVKQSAGMRVNPTHRADFNRLLGAAMKPPKSSGQT